MESISFCVTGHRPNKLFGYDIHSSKYNGIRYNLKLAVYRILKEHAVKNVTVYSGMALGVDQIFVEAMIDARNYYRKHGVNFKIVAAIPCKGQESKWTQQSQQFYDYLLQQCDEKVVVSKNVPYSAKLMQIRNEYMVDRSDYILAVWDGSPSGTANCVNYAVSQHKNVVRITY